MAMDCAKKECAFATHLLMEPRVAFPFAPTTATTTESAMEQLVSVMLDTLDLIALFGSAPMVAPDMVNALI